ncbi:MAG: hypothetical protein ABI338_02300 [Gemmatimonadaceae bacterium]
MERATARATALRILAFESHERRTSHEVAAHVERVLAHVYRALSEWVGQAGSHALFVRAITLATPEHPVLVGVLHREGTSPHLAQLAENAGVQGTNATIAAATTVLTTIIATLSGLIGEDIALSLLDNVTAPSTGARDVSRGAVTTAPQSNHGNDAS